MHTILGHFYLDIDFWPHFLVFRVWSIFPIYLLTFLECVLCLTNSFGGIRHVTVTFHVLLKLTLLLFLLHKLRRVRICSRLAEP